MATTIKVIDKLQDAIPYSDMGLLWMKYSRGEWVWDDCIGYWGQQGEDSPRRWREEQKSGILYGVQLEE